MKVKILTIVAILFLTISCKNKENSEQETVIHESEMDGDNSKNSIDWPGIYRGILPCNDCKGIQKEITLNEDETFTLKSTHLFKEKDKNKTLEEKGSFTWNKEGSTITTTTNEQNTVSYIVGEKKLIQLDHNNKEFSGTLAEKYILTKIEDKL